LRISPKVLLWLALAALLAVVYGGGAAVGLVVDWLWFDSIELPQVFRTIVLAKLALGAAGALAVFALLLPNFLFAVRQLGDARRFLPPDPAGAPFQSPATPPALLWLASPRGLFWVAIAASALPALLAGIGLAANWDTVLLYLNARPFGHADPIFGLDAGFYVFSLPLYTLVRGFLWSAAIAAAIGTVTAYYVYFQGERARTGADERTALANTPRAQRIHVAILAALLLVLHAAGLYLDRFELMHQAEGLFTGPGYAGVNGTLPVLGAQWVLSVLAAAVIVFAAAAARWRVLIATAVVLVAGYVGGGLYAPFLQRFVVTPNELERERPYLAHHIGATNFAYALHRVVERNLSEEERISMADIERNRETVNNVRLWDHEPLLDTFGQIQEIRTYYDFVSVDNDRYRIDGELRQTMLSPRELNSESLPSRTWVNERLTFTHGYGLTVGPVNRVNEQGLPVLYVQDLPPRSSVPELEVSEPEIYFGEVTRDYVFVRTRQEEFNYPEGDKNIFASYGGDGGMALDSLWRRLLLAAHTQDLKMLLSDDFTDETRILLYRNIEQRIRKVAPFLSFDRDPYMVIDEGRLYWIFDGYTLSSRFPYAEHVNERINYMRNPVKAVLDAYHGTIDFYLADPEEPIARAWAETFPGLLQPMEALAPSLRAHLRHPVDFFTVQTEMYATYHMLDVNTFYNREDQWSVPSVEGTRMEPYFTVMRLPGEADAEFIQMLPFTPRLKDNLAAWMVARNDGDLLGQLVVYVFPKQRLIYGPTQMVGRINQDPVVSQQITLWDRAGSNVIRGTLLVIPIEQSLIYVQPLYLRSEGGRIPELKRVIVGHGNSIAMGVDLDDALRRIFDAAPPLEVAPAAVGLEQPGAGAAAAQDEPQPGTPAARARRHYQALREAAAQGDWARFGRELEALGEALDEAGR